MEPLFRWGLLGPGAVAERFAQSLQAVNDAELAAVASRSLDRAQVFAKRFGSARAYDSYQALYEDAGIDAVYICTPHRFHYEQTKACLLAGKPVLCEKPLAINAQQGRELFALAHEQGVFLMEAMWTPLLPVYQQLKAWLIEGRIGNIVKLQSSFGFTIDRDPEYRLLNHNLAGGVLLDMGVYNVALSQWLINSERECITADGFIGETGVDEKISATINYSGGVCSQFQCSFLTQLTNDFFIIGSKGRIRL